MAQHFPFTAIVGSDDLALALTLTTISPEVGGVLVRGEKGTAKSTMVRALAAVLPPIEVVAGDRFSSDPRDSSLSPDGPFGANPATETRPVRLVELPVGATEDRVLGSLHLEKALSQGKAEYEPGLLARAHRGILYVDEVNLLHDHLVDLLLDAAAMGRSTVERDGVSVEHAARFVLVGTMNPEEGELRPQLLDRFGLTVEVAAPRDPHLRAEIVRRRIAYEADPEAFAATWAEAEADHTARLVAARKLVDEVVLGDAELLAIAELCAAFEVDGMRADIVTARAATAHAAWHGRSQVTREDIRAAARLALPHRRRRNPFDAPGLDEDLLDELLGDSEPEPEPPGPAGGTPRSAGESATESPPDGGTSTGNGPHEHENPASDRDATTARAADPYKARLLSLPGVGAGEPGKRSRAVTNSGRRVGARRGSSGAIHLGETIRAAAPHQGVRTRTGTAIALRNDDLRVALREGREANLILFCVDASGSMAARRRMTAVKTAVLSLLLDAYRRRDKVGLVAFGGAAAELVLPPTHSTEIAARRLDDIPAGGRTPLAEGLAKAAEVLELERIRDPRRRPLLVVVTDGRATAGSQPIPRAHRAAAHLAATGVACVVVDCETGPFRMGLAADLADMLGAEHVPLAEVTAEALHEVSRQRVRRLSSADWVA